MTNRRSFFKGIAGIVAGVALGLHCRVDEIKPDYNNAPYEIAFILTKDAFNVIKWGPPPKEFMQITKLPKDCVEPFYYKPNPNYT